MVHRGSYSVARDRIRCYLRLRGSSRARPRRADRDINLLRERARLVLEFSYVPLVVRCFPFARCPLS